MTERQAVTLITGASAGIGAALAHVFARNGHRLLLVARREDRLAALADDIAIKGYPRPLHVAADLALPGTSGRIAEAMARLDVEPDMVVNNAGYGLLGPAAALDRDDQLAMIDLNVRALADLSLAFLDSLERRRGGILNVASVAAYLPGPNMAVYYAGKAFVLSLGEALHWELKPRGIRVTTLCPGPVPTEFQARAGFTGESKRDVLTKTADEVAEAGYRGVQRGARVVVPGMGNWAVTSLVRFFPRGLLSGVIGRYNSSRLP